MSEPLPNDLLCEFESRFDPFEVSCEGVPAWSLLRQRMNDQVCSPHWQLPEREKEPLQEAVAKVKAPSRFELFFRLCRTDTMFAVFSGEYRVVDEEGVSNINSFPFQKELENGFVLQLDGDVVSHEAKNCLFPPHASYEQLKQLLGALSLFRQKRSVGENLSRQLRNASHDLATKVACFEPFPKEGFDEQGIYEKLLSTFDAAYVFQWLFESFGIKKLFLNQSYGWEHLLMGAKMAGVSIYEIQHGLFPKNHAGYGWRGEDRRFKSQMVLPDKFLLYGDYWVGEMLKNGFWESEQLVATGSYCIELARAARKEYLKSRAEGDPVRIVITTQPFYESKFVDWLLEFVDVYEAPNPLIELIIKVHPFHGKSLVADAVGHLDWVTVVGEKERVDASRLIANSDIHISSGSTCLFESISLGVPTVLVPIGINHYVFGELRDLGAVVTTGGGELLDLIKTVADGSFDSPEQRAELYATDVQSRVASFVEGLT